MRSRAAKYAGFVEHPRYGKGPRFTGLDVADTPDGTVYCHWHSPFGARIPGTAVAADMTRQGAVTLHVTHYFDAKRTCRRCGRPFLFFAEEQKRWYEELGFPLEADCLDCATCRKELQQLQAARRRYNELLENAARTQVDTLELVQGGLFLIEAGVFSMKLSSKLRSLLKPLMLDPEGPYYAAARTLHLQSMTLPRDTAPPAGRSTDSERGA